LIGGIEEEYLGFGIADAIIIKLSALKEIVVRPTSAVRSYVGSDRSAVEIARELDVEAALEGNIYRSGDRIRVTSQLITVNDSKPLWGDKFDERFTDIFDVEDSISEQVARALTLKLKGQDKKRLARHETDNFEAYQLYLKGRYHWAKRISEGTRLAAEQFRAAIDLDPNYTRAYAGLADCYTQLAWLRALPPTEVFPVAKAAALRALELDSSLAEAHASLAWINLLYDLDYEAAEQGFNRSLELNPNYSVAHIWYGVFFIATGRFSDALGEVNKALKLDPLSPIINAVDGWPFYFMRNYQQAVHCYKKAIELEPKSLPAHYLLAATYGQFNLGDKAVAEMQTVRTLDESSLTLSGLAEAYAVAGQESEAQNMLTEMDRMARNGLYVSPYDLAGVFVRLGDYEQAVELMEKTVEDKSVWRIFLPVDPKFDALRNDRRFAKLLEQIRQ
jgi:TolB-like protein/Flp pilus assembly protein TadD